MSLTLIFPQCQPRSLWIYSFRLGVHACSLFAACNESTIVGVSIPNVHLHPLYSFEAKTMNGQYGELHNGLDIAVLKLDSEVTFSHKIRPLCLSTDAQTAHIGQTAVAAGWGITDDSTNGSMLAHELRDTQVKVLPPEVCDQMDERMNYNQTQHLCVEGAVETWKGVRSGDSGGPLSIHENGRLAL